MAGRDRLLREPGRAPRNEFDHERGSPAGAAYKAAGGPYDEGYEPWWFPYVGPLSFLGFVAVACALGFGISAFVRTFDEDHGVYVCNWGSNAGLDLPDCGEGVAAPGFSLVSGVSTDSRYAFIRRIAPGIGVGITPYPDSHVEVNVSVLSLSPELIVANDGEELDSITLELDLSGLNVSVVASECSVQGNGTASDPLRLAEGDSLLGLTPLGTEPSGGVPITKIIAEYNCENSSNVWIEFAHEGHGFCVGTGHTCPNNGTIDRSSILGGVANVLSDTNSSTVAGGNANSITGGLANIIGAGTDNINIGTDSGVLAGNTNVVDEGAVAAVIGAGANNVVGNSTENCGVFAGNDNTVGATGTGVSDSVILAGSGHSIENASSSCILAGDGIALSDTVDDANTAATQNLLVTESVKTIGYRTAATDAVTVVITDYLILVNSTDLGPTTVTISADLPDGMQLIVKDTGDSAAPVRGVPTDEITITTTGGELICPVGGACATSTVINTEGGSVWLIHTTTGWIEIA